MVLVAYSDSEGSEDEEPRESASKPVEKATASYTVDRSNPGTIKVKLQQSVEPGVRDNDDAEPAAKRARTGPGAFSSFNSMLPAPKRDGMAPAPRESNQAAPRKVFSLKTGAEASFSRDSDAELRNDWANEDVKNEPVTTNNSSAPSTLPKPAFAKPAAPAPSGSLSMFKPLSVSRNGKKKKATTMPSKEKVVVVEQKTISSQPQSKLSEEPPVKKKISLFSSDSDSIPSISNPVPEFDIGAEDDSQLPDSEQTYTYDQTQHTPSTTQSQSLESIASDLNLTAAQRRQLFGRSGQLTGSAVNVVNFNTDDEYAANQALIAAGETIQHNPVRAIAPGKHSLRQLVNAAAGQKEALEESFAEGRRNKQEAGSKYGW